MLVLGAGAGRWVLVSVLAEARLEIALRHVRRKEYPVLEGTLAKRHVGPCTNYYLAVCTKGEGRVG